MIVKILLLKNFYPKLSTTLKNIQDSKMMKTKNNNGILFSLINGLVGIIVYKLHQNLIIFGEIINLDQQKEILMDIEVL